MKKLNIFLLLCSLCLLACDPENEINEPDPIESSLQKIADNQKIWMRVHDRMANVLPPDSIHAIRKSMQSQRAFLFEMMKRSSMIFDTVLNEHKEQMSSDVFVKYEDILVGIATNSQNRIRLSLNYERPIHALFDTCDEVIEEEGKKRGEWISVEKFVDGKGNAISLPRNMTSIFKSDLIASIDFGDILLDENNDDQARSRQMDDLKIKTNLPDIYEGLLLPAVQKYQDDPGNESFNNWLIGCIPQAIGGGLDRDIIRRIHAAGFLGSLIEFAEYRFENTDQDVASILLMKARYDAWMMYTWYEIWNYDNKEL